MKKTLILLLGGVMFTAGCLGDACDEFWSPDYDRGIVCAAEPGRCTEVNRKPDIELRFTANLATTNAQGKPFSAAKLKEQASCVAEFLRQRNSSGVTIAADNTTIASTTTFRRASAAFQFSSVASFNVECGEGGCAHCGPLLAEACEADVFCSAFTAQPLDAQNQCLLAPAVVGCGSVGRNCDDALTWGTNPAGVCHLFNNGCLPTGWGPGAACPLAAQPPACMM